MSTPSLRELCAGATPGPWKVEDPMMPDALSVVVGDKSHDWFFIADCPVMNAPDDTPNLAQTEANAALIARLSPEVALQVYEALEDAHDFAGTVHGDLAAMIHMRTAQAMDALDGTTLP